MQWFFLHFGSSVGCVADCIPHPVAHGGCNTRYSDIFFPCPIEWRQLIRRRIWGLAMMALLVSIANPDEFLR